MSATRMPLDCLSADRVRLAFAESLGSRRPDMYVPAQHSTGWGCPLTRLQAEAHKLAARGLQGACTETYRFPGVPDGSA